MKFKVKKTEVSIALIDADSEEEAMVRVKYRLPDLIWDLKSRETILDLPKKEE